MTMWQEARAVRDTRLQAGAKLAKGKIVDARDATALLEAVIRPGDRVCLEGDNQKQADLLASALAAVDPGKVHDLHMVQSGIVLAEHLDVFETRHRQAARLSPISGPQSARIATHAVRRQDRARRGPHLSRTVRPLFYRSDAACRADRRGQRRSRRQSLYRPQHRGHADRRRGDRLQGRHRHRPGQRGRRQGAARRHPGRSRALRRRGGQAVLRRAAVHARSRRRSPRPRS